MCQGRSSASALQKSLNHTLSEAWRGSSNRVPMEKVSCRAARDMLSRTRGIPRQRSTAGAAEQTLLADPPSETTSLRMGCDGRSPRLQVAHRLQPTSYWRLSVEVLHFPSIPNQRRLSASSTYESAYSPASSRRPPQPGHCCTQTLPRSHLGRSGNDTDDDFGAVSHGLETRSHPSQHVTFELGSRA